MVGDVGEDEGVDVEQSEHRKERSDEEEPSGEHSAQPQRLTEPRGVDHESRDALAGKGVADATGVVELHPHADPGTWLLENPGWLSGGAYRWFRDELGSPEVAAADASETFQQVLSVNGNAVIVSDKRLAKAPAGGSLSTWLTGSFYGAATDGTNLYYFQAKDGAANCANGSPSVSTASTTIRRPAN